MMHTDAHACRRALREIREIVAVSGLQGAQMSDQEALQTIAAIAGWAAETTSLAPTDCGEVIRRVDALIGQPDLEAMDDSAALVLFRDVSAFLEEQARPLKPEAVS